MSQMGFQPWLMRSTACSLLALALIVSVTADDPRSHLGVSSNSIPETSARFYWRRRIFRKCRKYLNIRSLSGVCNNLYRPRQGSAGTGFRRIWYFPSTKATGADRPNPREISNEICNEVTTIRNRRRMSEMVTFFGQLIDHTFSETKGDGQKMPIIVPKDDEVFPPNSVIDFTRTKKVKTRLGFSPQNLLSSYIDAASIYGTSEEKLSTLRAGARGKLKTSQGNLLFRDDRGFFVSGDDRVNENPALTAMHTLFMREHNRLCDEIFSWYPYWSDERIFQSARKIVIAEMQAITFYEFVPAMLGRYHLPPYRGYRRHLDASISNAFSTAAYRVGHTLINSVLTFIDANGNRENVPLKDAFFKPKFIAQRGIDSIIRGVISSNAAEVDTQVTSAVRNFLLATATDTMRVDLASLNIQRGRDHAIPTYNQLRVFLGLRPVHSFYQITRDFSLASKLSNVYNGELSKVDAWIGGLAERHLRGSSLGPLFSHLWMDQFARSRDGDRFYFERRGYFEHSLYAKIGIVRDLVHRSALGKTMRHIIAQNTDIDARTIQRNVFKT